MKALVISGGGSKGAFAGGVAEFLISDLKKEYDIFTGSSTGSLLAPMLAAGAIDRVKECYTTVTQKDIFSVNPFVKKKNNAIGINHLNILKQFLKGRSTFGESANLLTLIKNTFTKEDYDKIITLNKKVVVSVSNFSRNRVEYKYIQDFDYNNFCEWIWISSNFVPFMTLARKNGFEYADGGFGTFIPIAEAVDAGATELDVIILSPRKDYTLKSRSRNAFGIFFKSLDFMLHQIAKDEKYIGLLQSLHFGLKVRYFHTPRILTENPLNFDPEIMGQWWDEGKRFAEKMVRSVYKTDA